MIYSDAHAIDCDFPDKKDAGDEQKLQQELRAEESCEGGFYELHVLDLAVLCEVRRSIMA